METLSERIAREGPLEMLDAVGWAIRVAKRLEVMHKRGQAHGSLCPSAVAIAAPSRTSDGKLFTITRVDAGPEYRSPERLNSRSSSIVDDTWALAATLYAMLTSRPPFPGANEAEVKRQISTGHFEPVTTFDVGDDDLQKVLADALTRDLGTRVKTAAAFRRALEAWHPDPGVKSLEPIPDEASEEEEELLAEERAEATVIRSAPMDVFEKARRGASGDSAHPPSGEQRATPVVPAGDEDNRPSVPRAPGIAKAYGDSDAPPDDAPTVMAMAHVHTSSAEAANAASAGGPRMPAPVGPPPPVRPVAGPTTEELEQLAKPMVKKKGMSPVLVVLLLALLVGMAYVITARQRLFGM